PTRGKDNGTKRHASRSGERGRRARPERGGADRDGRLPGQFGTGMPVRHLQGRALRPARRDPRGRVRRITMNGIIETRQLFVAGQLVDYWESPDHPFGWAHDDLQAYVDRREWVLLFNAVALTAARPAAPYGS